MKRPVFFLCLVLSATFAHAAESARSKLDAFAKGINAISADFEQQVHDPNGGGKSSRGTLALKAPRQFRWT